MPTPTHRSAREDPLSIAEGWLQVVSTHHASPQEDVEHDEGPLDLVIFDMDGTLVEGSSWEMVHEAFGVTNRGNWERYQRGELDDLAFMRSDIALWHVGGRQVHVGELEGVLGRARVMQNARRVVDALRARRVATCILSGGLDLLAHRVCLEVGIDMYVANGLRLRESGHLEGEGIPYVEIRDKGKTAREILRKLGIPRDRAAAVGNSAYDVPMFRQVDLGVAFNPSDDHVRRMAHAVVEGTDMLPVGSVLLDRRAARRP